MDSFGSEEEYQEAEIWGLMMNHSREANKAHQPRKGSSSPSNAWGLMKTTPRSIPRATAHEAAPPCHHSSAPLEISNWSTAPKKNKKGMSRENLYCGDYHDDDGDDGDGDGDGDEMVPPHEYLAKKFARTQIASYSMCEGVGGTLKGRDLSTLRNAILTKTGFLE